MALSIGNKTFMNLQEAVGWLLENNALPFQSTANYVGNTEIAMSTLINPSPAKVRVGSIIFFADSKVSTVVGVTSNSFIVSDQYNDLVDDIVYVSNVAINASGHLITTLSNGDTIDAGLIKQISSLSINGSMHLIANYNDGSSIDVGSLGDFTSVDFKAKTLEQSQANYSYNADISSADGLTITNIYNRFIVINNVLHVICNIKLTNDTASNIRPYAAQSSYITVAHTLAQKIIDLEGDSVAIAKPSLTLVCATHAFVYDDLGQSTVPLSADIKLMNTTGVDSLRLQLRFDNINKTYAPGDSAYITARMSLTLI